MMTAVAKKNILLLYGGGGNEHAISITSKNYISDTLTGMGGFQVFGVEILKNGHWEYEGKRCFLKDKSLQWEGSSSSQPMDFCIPCLHGYPGETGHIQGLLMIHQLPFLGCNVEASTLCMNKVSTKLWLEKFQLPVVPYEIISGCEDRELERAEQFLQKHQHIFIKASSEGSSVGVYSLKLAQKSELKKTIELALSFSPYVLLEMGVKGRELEVATFAYHGSVHATDPGEITCPSGFYSYEEKYDQKSQTKTHVRAEHLDENEIRAIKAMAKRAFEILKIKDLARVDFFLTADRKIYINEVNTFPGMTPISLFPKMMIRYGVSFNDYLADRIHQL